MGWWMENHLRLIQTNLMETDANLDPGWLVRNLLEMKANALMMNTGGIVAFYPTELAHQWRNPLLTQPDGTVRDLIGEMVEACHKAGIRFFARFDFSKADESLFMAHPEWFYENAGGERMRFNGTVATCVNGWYQREGSLEILREALTRYPVDGVFFNMFGYQTRDYSGRSFGICRCEACRTAFLEAGNGPLPEDGNPDDPAWPAYHRFQHQTTRSMLSRIRAVVKGIREDIAISTYDEHEVDVVRKESNTELDRPYPFWLYSASENVQSLQEAWPDKRVSNCCINAVGLDVRFMGVSPHQVEARLLGSLAAGSGLDYCIIGDFPGYPDLAGPQAAARVFRYAASREDEYGSLQPVSEVALVKPDRFAPSMSHAAYQGCFRALKERHVPFEVLHAENLEKGLRGSLPRLRAVLLPALPQVEKEAAARLEAMRRNGVLLLATGCVPEALAGNAFPMRTGPDAIPSRSAYLDVDGGRFPSFPDHKWVFLGGEVRSVEIQTGTGWTFEPVWPLLSAGRYGPPEKCGGHVATPHMGAMVASRDPREGSAILLPWHPDYLFLRHGYREHRDLPVDLLLEQMGGDCQLVTDAPACVEVFLHAHGAGGWMIQLLNHSGFNGTTFDAPIPVRNIRVELRLPPISGAVTLSSLYREDNVGLVSRSDGTDGALTRLVLEVPELGLYEGIRLVFSQMGGTGS